MDLHSSLLVQCSFWAFVVCQTKVPDLGEESQVAHIGALRQQQLVRHLEQFPVARVRTGVRHHLQVRRCGCDSIAAQLLWSQPRRADRQVLALCSQKNLHKLVKEAEKVLVWPQY